MSIYSRTALLLQKELYKIEQSKDHPWGISIELIKNNLYHWSCTLKGPPDTPWEGGLFVVEILFSEEYNEMPPNIYFVTVPFHPNVDIYTGRPCLDYLDDPELWNPHYSILMILCQIQAMLNSPVLHNPINLPAAEMYAHSPRLYDQLVRDSVVASRRIAAGLQAFDEDEIPQVKRPETKVSQFANRVLQVETMKQIYEPEPPIKRKETIPFQTYYDSWKNYATSVPAERPMAIAKKISKPNELLAFGRKTFDDKEMAQVLKRHHRLWYGKFPKQPEKIPTERHTPAITKFSHPHSRIPSVSKSKTTLDANLMAKYSQYAHVLGFHKSPKTTKEEQSINWEEDADKLLDWSHKLNLKDLVK